MKIKINGSSYFYILFISIFLLLSCRVGNTVEFNNLASNNLFVYKNNNNIFNYKLRQNIKTYYLSPYGNDSNSGISESAPWKTFKHAFSRIMHGEQLILLNGKYGISTGTGGINRNVTNYPYSGQPPSGKDKSTPTIIRALNPGNVIITVPLLLGNKTQKVSNILIMDITFEHNNTRDHSHLYNSSYITIKNSGFHGGFSIGTNDHHQGNSDNLIEDVWIWATNKRGIAVNYRSHYNIWRRVIVRSDGCDTALCNEGASRPSVGITVYDSHDVSIQNVFVIDRILREGKEYSDFATAQHTSDPQYHLGRNEWLGCMSLNSVDFGMYFEADNVLPSPNPVWTIKDFVSIGNPTGGINIGNKPYNYNQSGHPYSSIDNATIILNNTANNMSAIRVTPSQDNVDIKNCITMNATRTGYNALNSRIIDSAGYNPLAKRGNFDDKYGRCKNCVNLESNPLNNGTIKYPVRIETGSYLKMKIPGIGSDIVNSYGRNGSHFGERDYNKKFNIPLWPWPNEERITKEMCSDSGVTRGFCSKNTINTNDFLPLTRYIFEFLGNTYELPQIK